MIGDAQRRVQAVIEEFIERGVERGLQVAAYLDGELIVDAWAGVADGNNGRPVDGETLFTVFSCTKGVAATLVHILADRGKIDYDTPVAQYWPAFGGHGKEQITVRHVLSHMSGIPHLPDGLKAADLCDWDGVCQAIAALSPLWEPGTRPAYSSFAWGWIVGEIVRCVDGRPIAQVVQEEICRPLGIDSLFFGIPGEAEPRVALLEDGGYFENSRSQPPDPIRDRNWPRVLRYVDVFNRPDVRRASLPSIGGVMNARALAQHYAAIACGEIEGVRLLAPDRLRAATTLQTDAVDSVLGRQANRGLGYELGGVASPLGVGSVAGAMGRRLTTFGHAGIGGAIGFGDPEYRFAFALTKNRLTWLPLQESVTYRVACELRSVLGIPEA